MHLTEWGRVRSLLPILGRQSRWVAGSKRGRVRHGAFGIVLLHVRRILTFGVINQESETLAASYFFLIAFLPSRLPFSVQSPPKLAHDHLAPSLFRCPLLHKP
jgi:hypothetical protein